MPLMVCKKCGTWYVGDDDDDGLCAWCIVDELMKTPEDVEIYPVVGR